jgi:hypothetical protein
MLDAGVGVILPSWDSISKSKTLFQQVLADCRFDARTSIAVVKD